MARSNRHLTLAAVALPLLFLAMSGLAGAIPVNVIVVNTLFGQSVPTVPGPCSLTDAVAAANSGTTVQNCTGQSGVTNIIEFSVTGTINLGPAQTLLINTADPIVIDGPSVGGITIDGDSSDMRILELQMAADVTVENLTFANGGSIFVFGGGAILAEGASLTVENCTFVNNEAEDGGAIFSHSGPVTITNSTFFNNLALFGGAIYNFGTTELLTNDTFDANIAENDGGSLYNLDPLTTYKGSVFANGSPENCASVSGADQQDAGFNISSDASCAFTTGSSNVESPGLDPAGLTNNGGPTQTIKLVSGANAIGHDTDCTDLEAIPQPVLIDQRLFNRPNSPAKCDSGAFERDAVPSITLVPNTEKVQISRSTTDQVNMAFSFIDNGPGAGGNLCDAGNNALNGINVDLFEGTCAGLVTTNAGLLLDLSPFVVHTIGGQSYGTLFQSDPPDTLQQPSETVSARITTLSTPAGACGKWSLTIAVAGLHTASIGLGGTNPFALVLEDGDQNEACFDIHNAVVGGQIPTPARGARRGRR